MGGLEQVQNPFQKEKKEKKKVGALLENRMQSFESKLSGNEHFYKVFPGAIHLSNHAFY